MVAARLWEFTEELETGGIVIVGLHPDAKFDNAMHKMVKM
jgi:hypothetical protein